MGDSGRENPRSLHSNFLNCNSHNDPILVVDPHTCHIWYSLCTGCPINESKFISQRCHGWSHRVQFSWSVQPLCKYNRASKKFWESWVSNVGTAGFWSVFSLLRYYNLGPPWCSVVKKKRKKKSACQCRRCGFDSPGGEDPLEKEMTTHSSILAWTIPWTEEPGGLLSMESQRVGHNWETNTFTFTCFKGLNIHDFSAISLSLLGLRGTVIPWVYQGWEAKKKWSRKIKNKKGNEGKWVMSRKLEEKKINQVI